MEKNTLKDSVIKTLAIVGAVAVLSVGGLITTLSLKNLPAIASNLRAQVVSVTQRFLPSERIVLTIDNQNPKNGEKINLSFDHIDKNSNGSYSFFYECRDGIHLERDLGSESEVIFCNNPYNFVNTDNTLALTLKSSTDVVVEVPLSINFIENNEDNVSEKGEAKLIVNGEKATEKNPNENTGSQDGGTILVTGGNSGNTNSNNSNSSNNTTERTPGEKVEETVVFDKTEGTVASNAGLSDPTGYIDLKAEILEVGYIDRVTNVFTATSSVSQSQRGAVRFVVKNVGTRIVNSWAFNVVLPTSPSYIYHSKLQQGLFPGDMIEYTIGFDSIRNTNDPNTITVNVDPTNSVKEKDETNNIVKVDLPSFVSN